MSSSGFCPSQKASPTLVTEDISLNRWRNGRRYISFSIVVAFPPDIGDTVMAATCFCTFLQEYNLKYVDMIEEQLNEALTTYSKPVNGDNYVRRSNQR